MTESNKKELEISVSGEWLLKKLLSPVASEIGLDFKQLYVLARDKLLKTAFRKIVDIEDGKVPNPRVTRDVLWNGSTTVDEVCAEYFGGILASSRTYDGKDDSCIQFVDVVKSLSATQLRLHYVIYHALNKIMLHQNGKINVAQGSEIQSVSVWMETTELANIHAINIDTDFNVLWRQGLIYEYKVDVKVVDNVPLRHSMVKPTTFGVMLYAAAHNKMEYWRVFTKLDFGGFEGVPPPKAYATSLEELKKIVGLPSQ